MSTFPRGRRTRGDAIAVALRFLLGLVLATSLALGPPLLEKLRELADRPDIPREARVALMRAFRHLKDGEIWLAAALRAYDEGGGASVTSGQSS